MSLVKDRTIVLELVDGRPVALEWEGTRYLVEDEPTELQDLLYAVTHPPLMRGWRFQARSAGAVPAHVFDVIWRNGSWELARVFD